MANLSANAGGKYVVLAIVTLISFWLSHYLAVFPHEYAHSLVASLSGFKEHFWQIQYGGTSFGNLLLLIHIDEHVNYAAMHVADKDWLIALAAFAGPGIGNGLTYAISLWCMTKPSIQSRKWLFYFIFWWNVNSIGNFIDYVPIRTFSTRGDMANLAYGLHIYPWWILLILGSCVMVVVWNFYSNTLIKAYKTLGVSDKLIQATLLLITTLVLFCFYGAAGLHHYGAPSHFISLLSLWAVIPIVTFNWPWRSWVINKTQIERCTL